VIEPATNGLVTTFDHRIPHRWSICYAIDRFPWCHPCPTCGAGVQQLCGRKSDWHGWMPFRHVCAARR
jgi:hypothetical protein